MKNTKKLSRIMKTELLQPSLVSGHEMLKIAFCDKGKKNSQLQGKLQIQGMATVGPCSN